MPFTDPASNIVATITDKARNLSARSIVEGLSFSVFGWSLGRGGYNDTNPVLVKPVLSTATALEDQVFPSPSTQQQFSSTDFDYPNSRSLSCSCRILMDTASVNYGMGEIGLWCKILNSPTTPAENNQVHLFSIAHFPIQTITKNTAKIFRVVTSF